MYKCLTIFSVLALVACPIVFAAGKGEEFGYDPLQGKTYRGNLLRNGLFEATGLKTFTKVKWKFQTGDKVRSSPIVVDGVCYVGSLDGNFYAIDTKTGKEKWKVEAGSPIWSSGCVYDGEVFFGSEKGYLFAVNCETGEVRLKIKIKKTEKKYYLRSSPAIAYGIVFISHGGIKKDIEGFNCPIGPTYGYDIETGKLLLQISTAGGNHLPSPAIKDNYLVLMGMYGYKVYDLKTGMAVVKKATHSAATAAYATPVILEGDRILSTIANFGALFESRLKSHGPLGRYWINPELKPANIKSDVPVVNKCFSSPIVVDETIYVGSDLGIFTALGTSKNSGSMNNTSRGWTLDVGSPIRSVPSCAEKVLYFGTNDGTLYALPAAGLKDPAPKPLWTFKTGGSIYSSPWPGDGVLYVSSDDGYVYALE